MGSALGHTGGEATCTTLAVCTRCSESYGELAAHTFGHWVASDDKKVRECTECGASDEESFVKDANTIYTAPGKIYLDAYSKDWGYKDARYAVYIWNAAGNTWINMDATDKTGIYSVTIPEGYTHIIFCRMNGASTVNDWPNVWNQSTDIVLSEANVYTFNGNWDHYVNNNKKSTFDISTLTHDHVYNALTAGCLTDVHCVLCGDVKATANGHVHGEAAIENNVAPDCVNAGSYDTVVYCTVCNAEVSRETTAVDALGHEYDSVVTPATCTTAGYTTHTCSVCDDSYVDGNVDALGHKFTTYTSNNDATCTKDGTKTAKCDRCDVTDTLTDVGSALGHTEGEVKVENATAPTCTENGSHDNVVYCVICDAELSRVNEIDLAIGHAWNDGEVLVDATCTETGTMKHTCTRVNCGATEERPIPAKGHVHGEDNRCTVCNASLCEEHSVVIDEAVAATCTSTGLTEGKHCSVCNEVLVAQTVTEKLAHNYVAVVTPATCTTAGYTTHTCSGCNASYTDSETAALGHTSAAAVEENRTESTCTVAGSYDSVVYCSACGAEISRETIALSLAAHTPAEAVEENRVNSTCTAAGSYDSVVYCSACGAEISRETIALSLAAHTPAEAVEENRTESTCTAAGSYDLVVKCSACGAELSRETKALELAAHTPAAAVEENRINSTCTVAGSYDSVVKCSVCSAELSREKVDLELAAHTPATAVEENRTESTCTVAGSYESVVYCSACDTEISRETKTLELAAHAYGKWLVSGDNKVRECANCDEIEEGSLKLTTIYLVPGQWISDNPWFVAYFFNNSGNTHVKMTDSDNDGIYEAIVPEGYTSVLFCRMNPAYAEFGWNSGEKGQPGFIERVYNQSEDIALKDNINTYTFESWSNGSDGKSTFISSLGKHEHVYTTATCTENMKCCYGCGEEIENTALNHDHVAVVTPATCTTAGYTTYTCSRCGDTYTDSAVDALNHDMSDFVTTTAPSCEEDGVERSDCSRCDYFETRVLDAIGHKYTDDNDADCNNEGCEHTREVGCAHTNTIVLKAKAPTCIEDGYTEGLYCEDCKETLKAQETVGKDAENGHNYSTEWTVDVEPTCTAKGSKSNHCIYCESKANVTEVAAIGHTEITVAAVAATLTKWGKSEGKKCSVCGVTTVAQTTVKYVLYLKPNSNWTQASARFAAYFFNNSTNKNEWVSMTKTTINGATYYKCEVPEGYEAVIFCRMNPSATANNWNNKWNQSGDLFFTTIGNGKNVCSINNGQWDCGTNVTWSKI